MDYQITGEFIEACDCYVVCPCWVADDPDEGHCTGLFTWLIAPGSRIGGVDVGHRTVVAVTTHPGNRRGGGATTVLYVDDRADATQHDALAAAFGGRLEGPLADLAAVSGQVLGAHPARIDVDPDRSRWAVTVTRPGEPAPAAHARGVPRVFADESAELTLIHTALSPELGINGDPVTAQQGAALQVRVGELAAGYVEVSGRSGMRGPFRYVLPSRQGALAGAAPAAPGHVD
jgi:Protein of unknown function (DUF1326)